jgi:hypothetical protein
LLFLLLVPGRAQTNQVVRTLAVGIMVILTLSALNPESSTLLSIVAHWCFYLAILGPLFWVARLELRENALERVLIILWLFSTLSSIFGVLQAIFPGQFQPSISTLIRPDRVMAIKLASGAWVPRPMGLTDIPGGAASSGLYATLLGLGVTMGRPFRYSAVVGILSMVAGTICIYLCQIRAMVVMLAICVTVLFVVFVVSGRLSRLAGGIAIGAAIVMVAFYVAFALGGDTVTSRLETLVETDPSSVYSRNRGHIVARAFMELLPQYPFGAGLGRWGMMNQYFGAPEDAIWSEVQWGGWILDGGILMALAYPAAILVMLGGVLGVALRARATQYGLWAAVVLAYGVGTLALTFSYPIFLSGGGMDFWLITSVALRAARYPIAVSGLRPS